MLLRGLGFELDYFNLIGTRSFVAFADSDSFAVAGAAHGSRFQESQSPFHWTGSDGRPCVRYRD